MTIANTILSQLGGNKFLVMTGARDLINIGNGLQFTIGRNSSQANRIIIRLNGNDLYNMSFIKITKGGLDKKTWTWKEGQHKTIKEFNDIFFDQLQELFTQVTGMNTHL